MIRFILLFSLCLISSSIVRTQSPVRTFSIEFRLTSLSLDSDSSVYICGNIPQLASWNPGKVKMIPMGNHQWRYTIHTDSPVLIEYKYTLGSWEREGAGDNGNPLPNFLIRPVNDTIITNSISKWTNKTTKKLHGQVTGHLEYHRQIKGDGLRERDIAVWLPPEYFTKNGSGYPVIYIHDGQNLFDPATSAFGTDWQVDETCDSLIKNNIIKPVIIVGIYNSPDRMAEYTPGEKGDLYMKLVIGTIKPFIDKTYRTLKDRKNTFTGGSSAGGTISFMLAWNHPEVFSGALCLSPAFKIRKIDVIKDVQSYDAKKKPLKFYIDNGGKGLEEQLQPGIDEMIKALKDKGFREGKDFYWSKSPEAEHNEAAWAKRMPAALKIILER